VRWRHRGDDPNVFRLDVTIQLLAVHHLHQFRCAPKDKRLLRIRLWRRRLLLGEQSAGK
jgi:hypothetical protein